MIYPIARADLCSMLAAAANWQNSNLAVEFVHHEFSAATSVDEMKEMLSGRVERRLATNRPAKLEAAEDPAIGETVVLANVSEHGARLIADRHWGTGKRVVVSDSQLNFRANAEIVYCEPQVSRQFAVGLKFTAHQEIHLLVVGA
jgi:hypothetical protein